jgi:hypothetical protein
MLTLTKILFASICTFTPPSDWEIGQLKSENLYVQVGFLGTGSTAFRPSINLAIEEEVGDNLKSYVKAVKEIYKGDPLTFCRDLGKIHTKAGLAHLLEITEKSPFGELKILQSISVQGNKAYILTASVLKNDFPKLQKEILASLHSLELLPDLLSVLPEGELKSELSAQLTALSVEETGKEAWEKFQRTVLKSGVKNNYWKFQLLKEAKTKIAPFLDRK